MISKLYPEVFDAAYDKFPIRVWSVQQKLNNASVCLPRRQDAWAAILTHS
jgi:hypothetical protein